MRYQITHTTVYKYDAAVSLCQNITLLYPRNTAVQQCLSSQLEINPRPVVRRQYLDFFGNHLEYFSIEEEHQKLVVTSTSIVDNNMSAPTSKPLFCTRTWKEELREEEMHDIAIKQYIFTTPITIANEEIYQFALPSFPDEVSLFDGCVHLMQRIYKEFTFKSGFTTTATLPAELMKLKAGVCQDFANLGISCLRSLGIPVRYVSGYIETVAPPGQKKLTGADASHAWFSVFIPNMGWVDFDPTNNQIPSFQHITIGWGRDYFDVIPLKGIILGSGDNTLEVSVDVKRLG